MPQNDTEVIGNLAIATGNKQIMSQKTAVKYNPFVTDSDAELASILAEEQAAASSLLSGTAGF